MNKRIFIIPAAIVVCAVSAAAAFSIPKITGSQAVEETTYAAKLFGRVDITADNTAFVCDTAADTDTYSLDFTLTIKKTEPDFFARLDEIKVDGFDTDAVVITPDEGNGDLTAAAGDVLPTGEDGQPSALVYHVKAVFTAAGKKAGDTLAGDLLVDYTGGKESGFTDSYRQEIPFTVKFK